MGTVLQGINKCLGGLEGEVDEVFHSPVEGEGDVKYRNNKDFLNFM